MKLYIAEKPSLGLAIAAALPKSHKNQKGYIELSNGDVVSWCIGHILEQAGPEAYNTDFKKWRIDHVPITPEQWQLKPKDQTRSQFKALRKLVRSASEIIHASDSDKVTINSLEIDKSYSSYISTAGELFTVYKIDSSISIKRLTTIDNSTKKISFLPFRFNIISPSLNFNMIKRMVCA